MDDIPDYGGDVPDLPSHSDDEGKGRDEAFGNSESSCDAVMENRMRVLEVTVSLLVPQIKSLQNENNHYKNDIQALSMKVQSLTRKVEQLLRVNAIHSDDGLLRYSHPFFNRHTYKGKENDVHSLLIKLEFYMVSQSADGYYVFDTKNVPLRNIYVILQEMKRYLDIKTSAYLLFILENTNLSDNINTVKSNYYARF